MRASYQRIIRNALPHQAAGSAAAVPAWFGSLGYIGASLLRVL